MKNIVFLWLLLLVTVCGARANDSSLDWSGTPRQMKGQGTVSMQSEVVRMTIGRTAIMVDCHFVFRNRGPACTVRMGFPDDSLEREGSGYGSGNEPPQSDFESFKSYVNGREVKTRLMRGPRGTDTVWHVKTVAFPARRTLRVRDVYTTSIGSELTFLSHLASYTLHTGASWQGSIGRSDIIVTFNRPLKGAPLRAISLRSLSPKANIIDDNSAMQRMGSLLQKPGTIIYQGPGRPGLRGNTLRWLRTRWKPSPKDDINLQFNLPR